MVSKGVQGFLTQNILYMLSANRSFDSLFFSFAREQHVKKNCITDNGTNSKRRKIDSQRRENQHGYPMKNNGPS
jgi:hypothetical protein